MQIFEVPSAISESSVFILQDGSYKFILSELEEYLKKSKSKLDKPYENKNAYKIFRVLEPFAKVKHRLARMSRNYNISNAWIKCYELMNAFDIVPRQQQTEITHFANAELPGSFICAIHHYIYTMTRCKYRWVASSMIGEKNLEDSYGLYKNYPSKWLMDKKSNGDMTKSDTVMSMGIKAYNYGGEGVYLYTSDLGFDVSSDYNNQEKLHMPANIGQILCGLLSLQVGGCMITKQYTYFNPTNISIVGGLTMIFNKVFITKPMSSKQDNSEIYLVCIGLKRNKFYSSMVKMLQGLMDEPSKVFIKEDSLSAEFIHSINKSTQVIYQRQIEKINRNVLTYNSVCHLYIYDAVIAASKKLDYSRKKTLGTFFKHNYIKPIHNRERLKMKDVYRQRI